MRKCRNKNRVAVGTTTKQPKWYKRLTPTHKTRKKLLKWLIQAVKIDLSFGDAFKWIFYILILDRIFPGTFDRLELLVTLLSPFA